LATKEMTSRDTVGLGFQRNFSHLLRAYRGYHHLPCWAAAAPTVTPTRQDRRMTGQRHVCGAPVFWPLRAKPRPLVRPRRDFGLRLEDWHDLGAEPLQLLQRLLQRGAHRSAAHVDLLQAGILLLDGHQFLDNERWRATEPGARLHSLLNGGQPSVAGS